MAFSLGRKWGCRRGIWSMTGLQRKSSTFSCVRKHFILWTKGGVWVTLLLLFLPLLTQIWLNASSDLELWSAKKRYKKSEEAFLYLCGNFHNMPLNLCFVMLEIGADCAVWGTFYSVYSSFPSKFPLQQEPEDWSDSANFSLLPELNKFTSVRNHTSHNGTVVA